jgi:hypothetical protein
VPQDDAPKEEEDKATSEAAAPSLVSAESVEVAAESDSAAPAATPGAAPGDATDPAPKPEEAQESAIEGVASAEVTE